MSVLSVQTISSFTTDTVLAVLFMHTIMLRPADATVLQVLTSSMADVLRNANPTNNTTQFPKPAVVSVDWHYWTMVSVEYVLQT